MRRTGYFVDEIQLVITDKFMERIIKNTDFTTFEEYEEFLSSDFMGENILKAELIDYMIKDDLVYWDYVNYNEKNYAVLKKNESF